MSNIIQAKSAVIGGKLRQNIWLEINNGIITSINDGISPGIPDQIINETLIPGFIDMHCHGGGGKYFSDEEDSGIQKVIDLHSTHGTTTTMASLVTEPIRTLKKQIKRLVPFAESGAICGIHLEGPYLSPVHCGAHEPSLLRVPTITELDELLDMGTGHIKMITIAPELPNAIEVIEFLVSQGVVVALGHSNSDFETAKRAIDAGASVTTHFYNGLPSIDHHKANITSAVLLDGRLSLELILDGHHVNAPAVELMFVSAPNRTVLITDAMSAAGEEDGEYLIGSLSVTVKEGVARLKSNDLSEGSPSLAGSTLTMDRAFFNLCKLPGRSIIDAVAASSYLPAQVLGLTDRGEIAIGKRADLLAVSVEEEKLRTVSSRLTS